MTENLFDVRFPEGLPHYNGMPGTPQVDYRQHVLAAVKKLRGRLKHDIVYQGDRVIAAWIPVENALLFEIAVKGADVWLRNRDAT